MTYSKGHRMISIEINDLLGGKRPGLYQDWDFIELRARRFPEMDKHYRGKSRMDWDNSEDRIALVAEGGYTCDPDYIVLSNCEQCPARDDCSLYEEMLEDQADMEVEVRRDGKCE